MKAVIFDLFETLVTEWGHIKYTKQLMSEDLQVPYELFALEWGKLHDTRDLEKFDLKEALIQTLIKINSPIDEKIIDYVVGKRIKTKSESFLNLNINILSMLRELKVRGYKIGLISNCSCDEVTILKQTELYSYFDAVILSYEVGLVKPCPEIYSLCCQKLNVLPKECLYLGDGASDELLGAKDAGMIPMQVTWFIKEFKKDYLNCYGFAHIERPSDVLNYIY